MNINTDPKNISPQKEGELILRAEQWPKLIAGDPEETARILARDVALNDPALLFMPPSNKETQGHTLSAVLNVATNTRRAYRADWVLFVECCRQHQQQALPATIPALLTFIEWRSPYSPNDDSKIYRYITGDMRRNTCSAATLRRALTAISTLHNWLGLPDVTQQKTVKEALRMHTKGRNVQSQKDPLRIDTIERAIANMGNSLRELRDKALVSVAHSTLFRRAELRLLTVERYVREPKDDIGVILYSKTKSEDEDHWKSRCVTPAAVTHLEAWLASANITSGYLFRGINPSGRISEEPISDRMIALIFKNIGRKAGLSEKEIKNIGGHSTRIGAAHDLDDENYSIQSIAAEGGWKTLHMPLRYIDKRSGKNGAMAKSGRNRRSKT